MKTMYKLVYIFLSFSIFTFSWADEPVAMVTDVRGSAMILKKGGAEKLSLLSFLMPNTEISVEKNSHIVITYLAKPQEFTISGPTKIKVQNDKVRGASSEAIVMRNLKPEVVSTAKKFTTMQREKLSQATFEMRAAKSGVRLWGPVETFVLSTAPKFIWFGPQSDNPYNFTLMDSRGNALFNMEQKSTELQLPENTLKYGESYTWKVEVNITSGESLAASGKFSVIDANEADKLIQRKPKPGAEYSERVLYAALLETEGLSYESMLEWQALLEEYPNEPLLIEKAGY